MGAWRGVVLFCSLAWGCGGALPEEKAAPEVAVAGEVPDDDAMAADSPAPEDGEIVAAWNIPSSWGPVHRVKTILPPSTEPPWFAPEPSSLVDFRGRLYFAVNFEDGRQQLWKSDGTEGGTVRVKAFAPQPSSLGFFDTLSNLTAVGSQLFFTVGDAAHGSELWVTDGTTGGTRLVKDITPGPGDSFLEDLEAVDGKLVFFRYVQETATTPSRTEVWRSDGTEAGTVRVRDLGPDSSRSLLQAVVGDTLFFVLTEPAHGSELWETDGTTAGTKLVKDIAPGPDSSYPYDLRAAGNTLFFTVEDPTRERVLWKTDGTEGGTVFVEDLQSEPAVALPRVLGPVDGYLYLTSVDPATLKLRLRRLRVEGSSHSKSVATLPNPYAADSSAVPYITTFAASGDKLFFGMGIGTNGPAPRDVQLWVTDGTRCGTKLLVRPLSLSDEFESQLFGVDGRLLFSAYKKDTTGLDLWMSDGSVRGTRLLKDIAPGTASSFPHAFTRVGNQVFFVAHDETDANQLWVLPLRR